jgi:tetratricopeptide (TPR) repeat protein
MPERISLEMTVNAWVQLRGYRRGAGKTVLGIGYDLLACLTQWEVEGVLAHEISHAKLVQRGYKNWLNRGLGRMGQLARNLHAHVEGLRAAKRSIHLAAFVFGVTDRLTRMAARFVAGCSRQDEFDADGGAAALCGPEAIRSSLLKLGPLGARAARIPWNERVARLQSGDGFGEWLAGELASADFTVPDEARSNLFFKYSSHPSLADRLAALPAGAPAGPRDSARALGLLKDPDRAAEALISEIQKVGAEEERKDSKRLRRFTKSRGQTRLSPLQSLAVVPIIISVATLIVWIGARQSWRFGVWPLGSLAVGLVLLRLGRCRDKLVLPIPDYAMMKAAWQTKPVVTQEEVKAMEAQMQARVAHTSGKRRKELELAAAAYEFLGRCDYVRAHVAARLCLQVNPKSVEGANGLVVASAALGQHQQVQQALQFLQRMTGINTPSLRWGAGWALWLCRDWAPAEAFLERRNQDQPGNATLLLLLASSQANRGKQQSALLLAHQACAAGPANKEHVKVLVDLLLQAGYLREAQQKLEKLREFADDDVEIMMQFMRLDLLLRQFVAADQWVERIQRKQPGGFNWVTLGKFHEMARENVRAAAFYEGALAKGFYPEALLGLARLEAQARNKEAARKHLLAALDTSRELGEKAVGPLPLFHQINQQLLFLEEPVPGCRAWTAKFGLIGGKPPFGLENKAILVFAPTRQQAEDSFFALFGAMQPDRPPIDRATIGWSEARRDQQPDGPVRVGVQGISN